MLLWKYLGIIAANTRDLQIFQYMDVKMHDRMILKTGFHRMVTFGYSINP
jgi:hypothetical protein